MSGLLLHSPAEIAAKALVDMGLGFDPDASLPSTPWLCSAHVEMDAPDDVMTVTDAAGDDGPRDMNSGTVARHHGLAIKFRASISNVAWQKAQAVRNALETQVAGMSVSVAAKDGVPAATYRIACFSRIGSLLPLGLEAGSNRYGVSLNFMAAIRMTS